MDECHAENCKAKHPHKRFCLRGHDTFEVGRYRNKFCRECASQAGQKQYADLDPYQRERRRARYRELYRDNPLPFDAYHKKLMFSRRWNALRRLEQAVGASD